jgi:hypothetical protein
MVVVIMVAVLCAVGYRLHATGHHLISTIIYVLYSILYGGCAVCALVLIHDVDVR